MYAREMSQRDIVDTIEDIYGFQADIDDYRLRSGRDCATAKQTSKKVLYIYVCRLYVTVRKDYESKSYAVYAILGYNIDGKRMFQGCG